MNTTDSTRKIVRLRCGLLASIKVDPDTGEDFRITGEVSYPVGRIFECWTIEGFWRENHEPHELDIVRWFE